MVERVMFVGGVNWMTTFENLGVMLTPEMSDGSADVVDTAFDPAFRKSSLNCPEVDAEVERKGSVQAVRGRKLERIHLIGAAGALVQRPRIDESECSGRLFVEIPPSKGRPKPQIL